MGLGTTIKPINRNFSQQTLPLLKSSNPSSIYAATFASFATRFMKRHLFFLPILAFQLATAAPKIHGELKQWHKVTIDFTGPQTSENATPNPFTDYRLDVQFTNGEESFLIPGYFAADGNAANTGATSGNIWRVHFAPNKTGEWKYQARFITGQNVHALENDAPGKSAGHFDATTGSFTISPTDKTGRDFRAHGRLSYVGKHHLQFEGSKKFFLKAGTDAPENFLAYADFDGDFKTDGHKDNLVKTWEPHVKDWREGDPSWQNDKGKGIIGAVNYLADQGLNVFSFLTMNIDGDDRNVFPYLSYRDYLRLDCSRLDQWEMVFAHGTQRGMYLHFKTQECENVNTLDDGNVGLKRKLYYRELIARYSHHLALNWNLGEEVGYINPVSLEKKLAWARYFEKNDPYNHHIVIHNGNRHYDLLGPDSPLTGFSLQTSQVDFKHVHGSTLNYLRRSVKAGKPWVVAIDEPGDATHSLVPDAEDPTRDNPRKNALWGNLLAGGAGIEWYFGYAHPHSDLTCQDYRVRETMWKQSALALRFFEDHDIPFWEMSNANDKLSSKDGFVLAQLGKLYLVLLKHGQPVELDLSGTSGPFELHWFNPRDGGKLQLGSTVSVNGGAKVSLGSPPSDLGQDWLVLVRPGDPNRNYPPGISPGANQKVMLPRDGETITLQLSGSLSDDKKSASDLTSTWRKVSGPGDVSFANASTPATKATFAKAGTYHLSLSANDGTHEGQGTVEIIVEEFQARLTRSISASDSLYREGADIFVNKHLKVEPNKRTAFIKFDIKDLPEKILDAQLRLTGAGDRGSGKLRVSRGSHADWDSGAFNKKSLPYPNEELTVQDLSVSMGKTVSIPITKLFQTNRKEGTHTLIINFANNRGDVCFHSTASKAAPELVITFENTDGKYSDFGKKKAAAQKIPVVLKATRDFKFAPGGEFVTGYIDKGRNAMAVNAVIDKDKFAAATYPYNGNSGTYDFVFTTLAETDGECFYRVFVSGRKIGEVQNPETDIDYRKITHTFKGIDLQKGDLIRVEFNSASNGKIPEGEAYAFARGRWQSIALAESSAVEPFKFTYDISKAKKIHQQTNGIIVVEAEDYDHVDRQHHRIWHLTSKDITPNVQPDPDPNHSEGAQGRGYLEILPDTRVTHADPLVNGVSFTNTPGHSSVLYYPIEFTEIGRYYVWVRMNCTGSEDNGIHVGLDGVWPESGARMQFTGKHGQWQWDSRQRTAKVHTGVLGKIWLDVDNPGLHTIMFSMREDGFEFDRFLLTKEQNALKSKNPDPGPAVSPTRSSSSGF